MLRALMSTYHKSSNPRAQEGKTSRASAEAIDIDEDEGEGSKQDIHESVHNRHIGAHS